MQSFRFHSQKRYKAGISPAVRRLSRQATGGARGGVVMVSHLRHWSAPEGGGVWVRDVSAGRGRYSQHPQHHVSRCVADHEGGPAFTPTQQPPTCRLGGGGRAGPQGGGGGAGQEAVMSKSFKLVDPALPGPSSSGHAVKTDWNLRDFGKRTKQNC
ncbi:hypothetical protein GWK47_018752 [Chionoecetes opilio]|uniref:Uncharacterized protein n=1 Tax=Chionoecetes opilio TaxID=41210 RepID=A0A8J5CJ99_CHIOP|nr:hypothetical protein GWK47_018752 [Chionoecetes opilio]